MQAVVFFKCVSDPTRLRIVTLLTIKGELCVCDLVTALGDSQPKVSRHLAQLRNCGLLHDNRRGQWVYYSIHPDLPSWTQQALEAACDGSKAQLDVDMANLEGHPLNSCA